MELSHFVFVGVGKESDLYNDSIITEEMIKKTWKKIGIHKNKKETSVLEDVVHIREIQYTNIFIFGNMTVIAWPEKV